MGPLRPIHGLVLHFHPTQGPLLLRGGGGRCPLLGQRIAVMQPLAACVRALGVTDGLAVTCCDIHELQSASGWAVSQSTLSPFLLPAMCHALKSAIRVMSRVANDMRLSEYGRTENIRSSSSRNVSLHYKLVVFVLVQARVLGPITSDAPHARRRILRVADRIGIGRNVPL